MRRLRFRHLVWAVPLALAVGVAAADLRVTARARGRVFTTVEEVPARPVALVLGTARPAPGRPNSFYGPRIEAAAALFHAGRVRGILVSGDNSRPGYDEPSDMRDDLVRLGVPRDLVTLDFAGFDTLDSVVRAKEVFGQRRIVIVSQAFQCERALYVADAGGIDAVAFAADDVGGCVGAKVRAREVAARIKAFVDVEILGSEPRFLGRPVAVGLR